MFLKKNDLMKLTFDLRTNNQSNLEHIFKTQSLTLNQNKPNIGLAGEYGLYGSENWWRSIEENKIKHKIISGKIISLFEAGQDKTGINNSFNLDLGDKNIWQEGIYSSNEEDKKLFALEHQVDIVYIFDRLKSGKMLDIVIQMAVSYKPIEENTISKTKKFFSFWKK